MNHWHKALRAPGVAVLGALAGFLLISWPLFDIVAHTCLTVPVIAEQALDCALQPLAYLFAVWALLIALLLAMAVATDERPADAVGRHEERQID